MKTLYESILSSNGIQLKQTIEEFLRKEDSSNESMIKLLSKSVAIYKPDNEGMFRIVVNAAMDTMGSKCSLNWIDTSDITDMSYMFNGDFNGDISKWNTGKVKDMSHMFYCSKFNKDISKWDVSKVQDMSYMFARSKFNKDISKWNVERVVLMDSMFEENKVFNQDLSSWKLNVICDTSYMFDDCPIKDEYKPKPLKAERI